MNGLDNHKERRKRPRLAIDLPVEYRMAGIHKAYGGVTMNGNETGLLIRSIKEMPVCTKLNVIVLFPNRFRLTYFETLAEIVWKDIHLEEDWKGYQYGLKFIRMTAKDFQNLKPLFAIQPEDKDEPSSTHVEAHKIRSRAGKDQF